MWSDENGVKTRSIRVENRQAVKEAVGQYLEFKEIRRNFRIEEIKLKNFLDEFERNTTINNKTKMGYL